MASPDATPTTEAASGLLVIIPSRGRPEAMATLVEAWARTSDGAAHLLVCLDDDDPTADAYPAPSSWLTYDVGRRAGFAPRLSTVAVRECRRWFALASWGDDHVPRTPSWDTRLLAELHRLGTGFAYGDDRLQGERLPTACAMTSDIVATLGWMTPPTMEHLYVDDGWLLLGRALDRIRYLPDVVIEHMHPAAHKAPWDDLYREANSRASYAADRARFERYMVEDLPGDLERLRALIDR